MVLSIKMRCRFFCFSEEGSFGCLGLDLLILFSNNASTHIPFWGPTQGNFVVPLIKEEDPLDNNVCVTPLALRNSSDSGSVGDIFDSESSDDEDDLGFFVEMDEKSSQEDLHFFCHDGCCGFGRLRSSRGVF